MKKIRIFPTRGEKKLLLQDVKIKRRRDGIIEFYFSLKKKKKIIIPFLIQVYRVLHKLECTKLNVLRKAYL